VTAARGPLVVSWIRYHGRSADLARELDGDAAFIVAGHRGRRWTTAWRYPLQAVRTVVLLVRRRPAALVVMAPPLPLVVIGAVWAKLTRRPFAVDAHTGAVLSPATGRLRRRFPAVARSADVVIVTLPSLAALLPGCRTMVLHDPAVELPDVPADAERLPSMRHRVVFPASWYADEPLDAVADAARLLPDVEFVVTGRADRALPALPNLTLTGFLPDDRYAALLAGADVVLALTTREDTMQRGGYEGLALGRALVVSDTTALRDWVADAGPAVAPTGAALAAGVRAVLADLPRWQGRVVELQQRRSAETVSALAALRSVLGVEHGQQRREASRPGEPLADEVVRPGGDPTP